MSRAGTVLALLPFCLLIGCAEPETERPSQSGGLFVAVHIPEALNPLERGAKYEEPLDTALRAKSLGEVTGGGTQLGQRKPDGTHDISSIDLDVELADAERGLPLLRAELRKLHPPQGTELSYETSDGRHLKESLW